MNKMSNARLCMVSWIKWSSY